MAQETLVSLVLAVGATLLGSGLLVAALIAMAVWLHRRNARLTAEIETNWAALARSLGLDIKLDRPRPPIVTGQYRGRPVRLTGNYGGKNSAGSTQVSLKPGLNADVYLVKSRTRPLGVETLASGDADLDRRFSFQSHPPELLARAVADPALRQALAATEASLNLTPHETHCIMIGVQRDPAVLRTMLDQAAEAVEFVERELGVSLPQRPPPTPQQYTDLAYAANIKIPRWVLGVVALLAVLLLVACVCVALLPAARELLPFFL